MLLSRLRSFQSQATKERETKRAAFKRPFSMFSSSTSPGLKSPPRKAARRDSYEGSSSDVVVAGVSPHLQQQQSQQQQQHSALSHNNSNSSWAEMEPQIIGHFPIHPLSLQAKQVFVVRLLTPLAEYQEV